MLVISVVLVVLQIILYEECLVSMCVFSDIKV